MVKKSVTYKVDHDVLITFNQLAKENAINKSLWLENQMKAWIKENAKK